MGSFLTGHQSRNHKSAFEALEYPLVLGLLGVAEHTSAVGRSLAVFWQHPSRMVYGLDDM